MCVCVCFWSNAFIVTYEALTVMRVRVCGSLKWSFSIDLVWSGSGQFFYCTPFARLEALNALMHDTPDTKRHGTQLCVTQAIRQMHFIIWLPLLVNALMCQLINQMNEWTCTEIEYSSKMIWIDFDVWYTAIHAERTHHFPHLNDAKFVRSKVSKWNNQISLIWLRRCNAATSQTDTIYDLSNSVFLSVCMCSSQPHSRHYNSFVLIRIRMEFAIRQTIINVLPFGRCNNLRRSDLVWVELLHTSWNAVGKWKRDGKQPDNEININAMANVRAVFLIVKFIINYIRHPSENSVLKCLHRMCTHTLVQQKRHGNGKSTVVGCCSIWGEHGFSLSSTNVAVVVATAALTHLAHNFFSSSFTIPSGTRRSTILAFSFAALSTITWLIGMDQTWFCQTVQSHLDAFTLRECCALQISDVFNRVLENPTYWWQQTTTMHVVIEKKGKPFEYPFSLCHLMGNSPVTVDICSVFVFISASHRHRIKHSIQVHFNWWTCWALILIEIFHFQILISFKLVLQICHFIRGSIFLFRFIPMTMDENVPPKRIFFSSKFSTSKEKEKSS